MDKKRIERIADRILKCLRTETKENRWRLNGYLEALSDFGCTWRFNIGNDGNIESITIETTTYKV